jgi:hypothetical protein
MDVFVSNNNQTNIGALLTGSSTLSLVSMDGPYLIYYTTGLVWQQNMGSFFQRFKVKITDDGAGHWNAYVLIPEYHTWDTGSSYWKSVGAGVSSSSSPMVGISGYADSTANAFYHPSMVLWDFQELSGVH